MEGEGIREIHSVAGGNRFQTNEPSLGSLATQQSRSQLQKTVWSTQVAIETWHWTATLCNQSTFLHNDTNI